MKTDQIDLHLGNLFFSCNIVNGQYMNPIGSYMPILNVSVFHFGFNDSCPWTCRKNNTYSKFNGILDCIDCPVGTIQYNLSKAYTCSRCPLGQTRAKNESVCRNCTVGQYSFYNDVEQTCVSCNGNTYTDRPGQAQCNTCGSQLANNDKTACLDSNLFIFLAIGFSLLIIIVIVIACLVAKRKTGYRTVN